MIGNVGGFYKAILFLQKGEASLFPAAKAVG